MQLTIKGLDPISSDAVREFAQREVTSKLSRMSKRIRSIQLWVRDVNGPRGGRDHAIQFLVRLKPTGKVLIQHRDFDPYAGISIAIERASRAVTRALERRRSKLIEAYRFNVIEPAIRRKLQSGIARRNVHQLSTNERQDAS
jgi:ribosome-associated translation inhibitor RaiA